MYIYHSISLHGVVVKLEQIFICFTVHNLANFRNLKEGINSV